MNQLRRPPEPLANTLSPDLYLPVTMLSQYLFFLTRRPISKSNFHYLEARLKGLKSLRPVLQEADSPKLESVLDQLDALNPAAFRRRAPSLQLALLPLAQAARTLPRDMVIQDSAPPADWLGDGRRALLVFGPGIGIGDEMILSPLPARLKAANRHLEIWAISGYPGLWDRVSAVDKTLTYTDHRTVLAALRGEPPYEGFDLVAFGDFEAPELYRGVAFDRLIPTYLEISLGSRSAFLVDNNRRWLYRLHHITPYYENYYSGLNHLLRSLGLSADHSGFFSQFDRTNRRPSDCIEVFVSPFTSKYDPSQTYWSHLLSRIVGKQDSRPVRFVLDPGPNSRTGRFAFQLARSVAARLTSNCEVSVAATDGGGRLSLQGVFSQLERSSLVVCADSFAAHAGPLFDCLTLVIASAGLERWRVPYPGSFYFDSETPAAQLAALMRQLVGDLLSHPSESERLARFSEAESRIVQLTAELEDLLETSSRPAQRLLQLQREFVQMHGAISQSVLRWPAGYENLFRDGLSIGPLRALEESDLDGESVPAALMSHLRDQLERWRNSNLCKYLWMSLRRERPLNLEIVER